MSSLSTSIATLSISSHDTHSQSRTASNSTNSKDEKSMFSNKYDPAQDEMSCLICKQRFKEGHNCVRSGSGSISSTGLDSLSFSLLNSKREQKKSSKDSSQKEFNTLLNKKVMSSQPRQPKTSTFDPTVRTTLSTLSKGVHFTNMAPVVYSDKWDDCGQNFSKIRKNSQSNESTCSSSDKFINYRNDRAGDRASAINTKRDDFKSKIRDMPIPDDFSINLLESKHSRQSSKSSSVSENILDFSNIKADSVSDSISISDEQTNTNRLSSSSHASHPPGVTKPSLSNSHCSISSKYSNSNFNTSTFNSKTETALLGTPDYIAPELLARKKHDKAVDFWALGCCMYQFLIGMAPFTDKSVGEIFSRIKAGQIDWPDGEQSHIGDNIPEEVLYTSTTNSSTTCTNETDEINYKIVIKNLLHPDPEKRAGIKYLRNSEFFKNKISNFDNLLDEQPPFIPEVKNDDDIAYFEIRNARRGIIMSPGPMNMQGP